MSSTISNNPLSITTPLPTPAVEQAAGTAAAAPATQNYTPLWLVQSAGSGNSFEMLGIRMPRANGDLAALLGEISLSLEQSTDESQANRAKASLAALANALSPFERQRLFDDVQDKTATRDDTKKTLDTFNATTTPLLSQQASKTGEIEGYRSDIAKTKNDLKNPDLSASQRKALEDKLAQLEGKLGTALSQREAIDIKLAEARITALDQDIVDLQAQLARAEPGSTEANAITALIQAKTTEVANARSSLEAFRNGPKTEAARDAFSTAIASAVNTTATGMQTRLDGYEAVLAAAETLLDALAKTVLMLAAAAQSSFTAEQAKAESSEGIRDQGIEKAFELIAEGLDEASARLLERFQVSDATEREALEREDIQAKALAFVASLADLLSTLTEQTSSPKTPMPVPMDTVASRVRVAL